MAQPIRILLVEDDPNDARLVAEEVGRADFVCDVVHVSDRASTLAALEETQWDLIISDFNFPDMSGLELLQWVAERKLDVPVIIVSGSIGEEMAVLTMHAGAHDFIHKDSLARLIPAIERELQEQEFHRQRWLAEAALVESEQNFRQLTEAIPEVFWLIDCEQQQMLYLSPAFETVWERPAAQIMSQPRRLLETIHPEDHERITMLVERQGMLGLNAEYRIVLPDGTVRWINTRSFPVRDEAGGGTRIAGLSADISESMQLRQEREMMSRALQQSADAVMITDAEGVIIYVNPAFEDLSGYASSEVVGQAPSLLKSGFQEEAFYQSMWRNISNGIPFTDVFINRRKDGELYYEAKTITPVRNGEGEISHFVSTGKDITNRLKSQDRLNRMVNYDAVTGLANSILLQDRLAQTVVRFRRLQMRFGLLCLVVELEELMGVGHDSRVMEQLLRQVAKRLNGLVGSQDTVARMEQGEFMILHTDHEQIGEEMEALAKALVVAFGEPIVAEGYEWFLTPAMGISLFPADADEPGYLIDHARLAVKELRREGHGGYRFYRQGMLAQSKHLSS